MKIICGSIEIYHKLYPGFFSSLKQESILSHIIHIGDTRGGEKVRFHLPVNNNQNQMDTHHTYVIVKVCKTINMLSYMLHPHIAAV